MTRLQRVIEGFNDYDKFLEEMIIKTNDNLQEYKLNQLRNRVSLLIGELRRYGCRREN